MFNKTKIKYLLFLLIISSFAYSQVPSYAPSNGLQGWWSFSGNANDNSANNYSGIVNGAALTSDRFGNANSAYAFNGSSDFISTNYQGIIGNKARTVSFWAKTTNTSSGMSAVAWGDNQFYPNTGKKFGCHFNVFTSGITIDGADAAITYQSPCNYADNRWHHYVFKMDSADLLNQIEIYMDGIPATNVAYNFRGTSTMITVNNYPVNFGRLGVYSIPSVPPYYFQGSLDDIGIWNRALSLAEIHSLFVNSNGDTSIVKDTTFCSAALATLSAQTAQSYTWSNGANTQTISINNSGTYWVQLQIQSGCNTNEITDTIHANFVTLPVVDTLKDISICSNVNYSLNVSSVHASSYHWSTGAITTSIIPHISGIYWVDMEINNCIVRDSADITLLNPPAFAMLKDTVICKDPITLIIKDTTLQITWWNGSHLYQTEISTIGTYYVLGTKNGCTTTDTIQVLPMNNNTTVVVPNIFTPNGDGRNDVFEFNTNYTDILEFKIYNQWGIEVYSISTGSIQWDGKQQNGLIVDGTYFWEGAFQNACNSNKVYHQKGCITLMK